MAAGGPRPAEPFAWSGVLHAGLCLLRLEPRAFWALTPAEFAAMTGAFAPAYGLERTRLEQMMAAYPDAQGA